MLNIAQVCCHLCYPIYSFDKNIISSAVGNPMSKNNCYGIGLSSWFARARNSFHHSLFLSLLLALQSCGGGGGGGSSDSTSPPVLPQNNVIYQGSTTATIIDATNAEALISDVLGTAVNIGSLRIASINSASRTNTTASESRFSIPGVVYALNKKIRLVNYPRKSVPGPDLQKVSAAATRVNENDQCDGGNGSTDIEGLLETDGTGTLTMQFINCLLGDIYFNGSLSLVVNQFDTSVLEITDATYYISNLTITGQGSSASLGGTIRTQAPVFDNTETLTADIVLRDDLSGDAVKTENLVLRFEYENILLQNNYSLFVSGRVYDSLFGYVDIQVDAPLYYASSQDEFPSSGGPIVFNGANGSKLITRLVSPTSVQIDVWASADSGVNAFGTMSWSDINVDQVGNSPPNANAGTDFSSNKYQPIVLSGSDSSDADNDIISFFWRLTGTPDGSAAVLSAPSSIAPTFTADVTGQYTLELRVNDNTLESTPDQIVVTVVNQLPVVNLNAVNAAAMGTSIALSGTGSQDPDNEPVQITWDIIDAPTGSTAQLQQLDPLNASFTPDIAGSYQFHLEISDGEDIVSATHITSFYRDFNIACTDDADFGDNASGSYLVADTSAGIQGIAGICDGWVFLSDFDSRIRLVNAIGNYDYREYILPLRPGNLFHNVSRKTINATVGSTVSELDPTLGIMQTIPLSERATEILGKSGDYLLVSSRYGAPSTTIVSSVDLNSGTSTQLLGPFVLEGYTYAFSEATSKLYVGYVPAYTGNSFVERYGFSTQSGALTYEATSQALPTANGHHTLSVSPDGSQIAFMNGSVGESILDINASDLTRTTGDWAGNSKPYFRSDGMYLVTAIDNEIKIYSADTKLLVKNHTATCSGPSPGYPSVGYPRFSTGGNLVYYILYCNNPSTLELQWFSFSPA